MPTIKRIITAATANALSTLRFSNPKAPSAVSLWASSPTAGEDLSFGVDDLLICEAAEVNLEVANQTVDSGRDQILFREPAPPGQYVLDVPAVAADLSFMIVQELA